MENETADNSQSVKEDLFKRIEKRNEDREQQRSANISERTKNAQENQAILDKLNQWSGQLLNKIETSKPSEENSCKTNDMKSSNKSNDDLIVSISEEIQKFDGYFNEISNDLSAYDVRQTQIVTMQIKEKFLGLQDSLKPKKKFGFKSRNKKVVSNPINNSEAIQKIAKNELEDNKKSEEESTCDTGSYIVTNSDDSRVIDVSALDIEGRDVLINGLKPVNISDQITVKILGNPGTLHATNMENVIILCGPVRTSIFVENCKNCTFVVACQQLRIHTTTQSDFYLHVTSKGIIEDCKQVGFAPYNLSYPKSEEDFSKSGLNKEINNWDRIDDFNWLTKEKASPHWYILEDHQRKKDWVL